MAKAPKKEGYEAAGPQRPQGTQAKAEEADDWSDDEAADEKPEPKAKAPAASGAAPTTGVHAPQHPKFAKHR